MISLAQKAKGRRRGRADRNPNCKIILICLFFIPFTLLPPIYFLLEKFSSISSSGDNRFPGDINGFKHEQDLNATVQVSDMDANARFRFFLNGEKMIVDQDYRSGHSNQTGGAQPNIPLRSLKEASDRMRVMKNQLVAAKAYLNSATTNKNSHLEKELKQLIKESEYAVVNSDLSTRAWQNMKSMEIVLSKVIKVDSECSADEAKLRAKTHDKEDQVLEERKTITFLTELAERTMPKALHCLSMSLTVDYFSLPPTKRELPNKHRFQQKDLYHYAIFSDNVIACAVVVKSTISTSMEPEKIVFHIVTDDDHLPAITMWFLTNPSNQATVQVQRMGDFKLLRSSYISTLEQPNSGNQGFLLAVNQLPFYLPEIFPTLDKIVLLDHDVVVQRDLQGLWKLDMQGKVIGVVETYGGSDSSHRMDSVINFSDPVIAKRFNAKTCTWAFGMNVFNLQEWRKRDLTSTYQKWLELGKKSKLWEAARLPMGLVTFYKLTLSLDRQWHVVGLGHDPSVGHEEIEKAAVIHYDGKLKPWLAIGIEKYGGYWKKFVQYDHQYSQQCYMQV